MSDPIFKLHTFPTMVRQLETDRHDAPLINSLLDSLNEMVRTQILFGGDEGNNRSLIQSMSKLLSYVDCDSALAWGVILVLENYFTSSVSDDSLYEAKKLFPIVSKLASAANNNERKISLLKVLETLTYGIKLYCPESFLSELFTTLIDWSKNENTTVVQLSLSVIANLLHKNNFAIITLMQAVNLKAFMRDLFQIRRKTRGNIWCKMEVCKLTILLGDLTHEKPEEEEVLHFIKVSLCTILEASKCGNKSELQHCISFLADSIDSKIISVRNLNQPWIPTMVCKIVDHLESGLDSLKPDIAMLLFRFLRILLALNISSLSDLNIKIMRLGVGWVQRHTVKASEAVSTMYLILSQQQSESNPTCHFTEEDLASVFIPLLEITPSSRDGYLFVTSLLKFFTVALNVKPLCVQLQSSLTNEVVELFLSSIPSTFDLWNDYRALEHIVEMYVHLFVFVNQFGTSSCDSSWMKSYTLWLREQKVLSLLAVALICGSSDLKGHVLGLVSSVGFPGDCVSVLAKAMADGGKGYPTVNNNNHDHFHESYGNSIPKTVSMLPEVKEILHSSKNKSEIISGNEILKLYEYNDFVNSEIQNSMSLSLRSLTEQNSLLEKKMHLGNQILNQFRAKYEQLLPEFENVCAKYEDANLKIQGYIQEISALKEKLIQEASNFRMTMQSLKETSQQQEKELWNLKEQLLQKEATIASKQEELESLQREGNAIVSELKEREEKLEILNSNLKKEIGQLESLYNQTRERVIQLENDKVVKEKEIIELEKIRDTVFELTSGRKKL